MAYIGKDVIHYGCGLDLDPAKVLEKVAHSSRKNIRKAEKAGFAIERQSGSVRELAALRRLWYQPEDPNFPVELSEKDFLYVARLEGDVAGAIILLPVGSHLFLNNLFANEVGKEHQLQGYLLWHVVNELQDSEFNYIDVGVSYRPNLYRFFKKWSTFQYPVIFHPPLIRPLIRFTPFKELPELAGVEIDEKTILTFCAGRPYTIVPDIDYAVSIARDRGWLYKQVGMPDRKLDDIQLVDLPELLPIQYGAMIIGIQIPPAELWDRYGCYDDVKTNTLKKTLSRLSVDLNELREARRLVFDRYAGYFVRDDVVISAPDEGFSAFVMTVKRASEIAERYHRFGVEVRFHGQEIRLPCHQNISPQDVEYIYGIYRGFLNLCSEWIPTHVRGVLKSDATTEDGK